MDLNDFRLGNWVYLVDFGSSNTVYVNEKPVRFTDREMTILESWGPDVFAPIPLTHEKLKCLGFKEIEHGYDLGNGYYLDSAPIANKGQTWVMNNGRPHKNGYLVTCLHELQNAYYVLSGHELEICI